MSTNSNNNIVREYAVFMHMAKRATAKGFLDT